MINSILLYEVSLLYNNPSYEYIWACLCLQGIKYRVLQQCSAKHSKSNENETAQFHSTLPPAEEIVLSLAGFNNLRYQSIDTISVFWTVLGLSLIILLGQGFSINMAKAGFVDLSAVCTFFSWLIAWFISSMPFRDPGGVAQQALLGKGRLTLPPVAASCSFLLSRSFGKASMAPHERLGLTGRRWQLADPDKRSLSFPPHVAFSWSFCTAGLRFTQELAREKMDSGRLGFVRERRKNSLLDDSSGALNELYF